MVRIPRLLGASIAGLAFLGSAPGGAFALDGKAIVAERCVSCHNVSGPAPVTFEGVLSRKGPDLFYAGSKFNRPWLVEWLHHPILIRPSGMMFLNHVTVEGGRDRIGKDTINPCPAKLGSEEAEAVTDYLMTLTDPAIEAGVVDSAKKFSKSKSRRLFTKQLPCIGCHIARFGKKTRGGISGPNLTNAGERLNPDWVYARIADPQYWDPKTWMPKFEMSHNKREMLTLLIASMR